MKEDKWNSGLAHTRNKTFGKISNFFGFTQITDQTWDELEALMIQADMGVNLAVSIVEKLKEQAKTEGLTKVQELKDYMHQDLRDLLIEPPKLKFDPDGPTVILMVGVNGSGKTTSAAKLAKKFQKLNKKVVMAAADTFRAAAVEQLQSWGEKLDIRVITGQPEADPGSVVYDAVASAVARDEDVLLVDTAGRLHTRFNLMEELKKVYRVAGKPLEGAPHHVWLVIDSTTGQNAMQQAIAFKEAVQVTGIILAKLDSSASGGMAFAIQQELGLPIFFAGLGEGEDDLVEFDPDKFISGILSEQFN